MEVINPREEILGVLFLIKDKRGVVHIFYAMGEIIKVDDN